MRELIPILQFGGAFTAFFMAIAIFMVARKRNPVDALLGWVLLLIAIVLVRTGISVSGLLKYYPHQLAVLFPLTYLIGPLLLFYARGKLLDQPFSLRQTWPHFLPVMTSYILLMPVFLLSTEEKLAYIALTHQPNPIPRAFTSFSLSSALNLFQLFLVWAVVAGYALLAWRTVSTAPSAKPGSEKYQAAHWVSFLSVGLMLASVAAAISLLLVLLFDVVLRSPVLMITYLSFVAIAGYSAIQLVLSPGMLHAEFQASPITTDRRAGSETSAVNKYKHSGLSRGDASQLSIKLQQLLKEECLYRQPDLNLQILAERLGCSSKHLSQILNEELNENFYEFVNRHRIEEIKQQLQDGALAESPIIDIALNAGFNSKPSFYNAFRKHTGMTPTEYVKLGPNNI